MEQKVKNNHLVPARHKLTDSAVKNLYKEMPQIFYTIKGKYINRPTDPESVKMFIANSNEALFQSRALNNHVFTIGEVAEEHLFGKARNAADYIRRASLFYSGLEIAELSSALGSVCDVVEGTKSIRYYEMLGLDPENFPGKLIKAVISEQNRKGKVLFTITDIRSIPK